MTSYTPNGAAEALKKLDKTLTKEHVKALRRVLGRTRTKAIAGFASRGVGRTIYGKKKSDARKLIKRQRVQVFNNGQIIASGFEVVGLAALQEAGGTTRKHTIRPKRSGAKSLLVFEGRGGAVFARVVNHPGSRIPAMPFAEPALRAAANGDIAAEFEKATQAAANTVG